MEHEAHLSDDVDRGGMTAKFVALAVIVALIIGAGAYMVYGSGMWNPPTVPHSAM